MNQTKGYVSFYFELFQFFITFKFFNLLSQKSRNHEYTGLKCIFLTLRWLMKQTLQTSTAESVNAAGNIFVGQTEAPLLIAPFIKTMSISEVHSVMTGGFATIAGGVLAAYIQLGIPAQHLIAASVMSAPAALAISKLVFPEDPTRESDDSEKALESKPETANIIEAAAKGAAVSTISNKCFV